MNFADICCLGRVSSRGLLRAVERLVLTVVVGGLLAFGAWGEGILPQEYTQLEWIESDGEQYIDTRYIPTESSRVTCEFEAPAKQAHPWPAVFGARSCQQGMYANELSFFTHSNREKVPSFVACGEHVKGTRPFTYGTRVQLSCGADGRASWRAGESVTDSLETRSREARACLSPLFLFCQGHAEAPYGHEINANSRSCVRLFSCRVFEGGKIVCDFRPCRDPEGEAGLYDVVRQVFYGNIGKGAFKGSDGVAQAVGGPRDIAMLAGEKWWGAANGVGAKMPFDDKSRIVVDLLRRSYRNQYASLLVSNLGRVIWCEKQCRFEIANGRIKVVPLDNARVILSHPGKTLREAFRFASHAYFPPSGKTPDELFIRSLQVHALCGLMQFSASPWKRLTADECQIVRDTIKMRQEKFAARFVELARECGKTGEPMIRLMEYQFPGNGWADVKDQFVMGDFLIVAPQLKKGAISRTVVIPPGAWVSDRGEKFVGPTTITVETPLSRLPYFTRNDK